MSGGAGPAVFGLLGHPVAHSRSPAMWRAAFAAAGVDAVYAPFDVPPDDLAAALAGARALGVAGLNVTVPHKAAVLRHLDAVDGDARILGAANVIARDRGRLVGLNTDAEGLARALDEAGVALAGRPALVLGAGGAARAAALALARCGASEVWVSARRPDAARALADALGSAAPARPVAAPGPDLDVADVGAVVQATSATLAAPGDAAGAARARAFAETLPLARLAPGTPVVDLVYAPRTTAVLARAEALGLRPVDGLGMLLHQAALAWARWCPGPAPLAAMRAALDRARR